MSLSKEFIFIIPAFNEESSILHVVTKALKIGAVLVVNDNSSDQTKKIVETTDAYLLSNQTNLGYEKSLVEGLRWSISKGFKYGITIDGDGQLNPNYGPVFLEELKNDYDLVIGARNNKPRISERVSGLIASVFFKINDPFCGLKGYNLEILSQSEELWSMNSIGTELAIRMIKGNRRFKQVEIDVFEREGESKFGSNTISLNFRFIYLFIRTLILSKPI